MDFILSDVAHSIIEVFLPFSHLFRDADHSFIDTQHRSSYSPAIKKINLFLKTRHGDGRGLFPALKKEGNFAVALHD